ncbi:MAG: hypothetical protein CMB80_04720 [Flammeovirgaceae bacterium]|nr:hypothetical protein [Flammeovirgaceae bacterium]|tara:strand:+ start:754 stop:1488 length:735 start_codon:yes stop_codon:yes gene_type:complete
MNPKVTIVIPCYNAEKWIEKSILSAITQDYENIEVIFIDNESIDNSATIAAAVKETYPQLIVGSAPNVYPNCWDEARAVGLEMMTGEYVMTMGADDWIDKSFIGNCMHYVLASPDKILAFQSPIKGVREEQETYTGEIIHTYRSLKEFKQNLLERCPVNTPTVIFKRSLYDDGLLETHPQIYGGAADYDLYCRLADNDIFIYPAPRWLGFYYRWHSGQATWQVHKEGKNYDRMIQDYWKDKWKI